MVTQPVNCAAANKAKRMMLNLFIFDIYILSRKNSVVARTKDFDCNFFINTFFLITICDLRFTTCDLRGCIVTSRVPGGAGRGFRLLTAFAAEWWSPPKGTGGDWRRGKRLRQRHAPTRRPSPPSSPRLRRTIPRNATALSGISSRVANRTSLITPCPDRDKSLVGTAREVRPRCPFRGKTMSRRDNRKCVVPAGRRGSWCAASFYRASVPGGTWGICKVRGL